MFLSKYKTVFYLRGDSVPCSQTTVPIKAQWYDNLANLHRAYHLPFGLHMSYLDIQKTCHSSSVGPINIMSPRQRTTVMFFRKSR